MVVEEVRLVPRAELLARTFVDVADTLVDDFDLVDFLTRLTARTVELFELAEAGLLLADPSGGVNVAASEQRVLAEQLQFALDSRVTIEQAKGVIAERASLDMDAAFAALRQYARNRNERLVDVAHAVASRTIAAAAIALDLGLKPSRGQS
jgi:hypothetical protein